ncbi:zwei Ig domain protein zig-8-like [Pollicipes pollicipes]|uniref:zwei Ig domain protein zig-8-like n=1 Tax=Pollicipes pollicipes TaxID=41117 RepID=UPI0018858F32|nr:zwei Ig domain protein zig-8-like [Pollicipes pollicipes]
MAVFALLRCKEGRLGGRVGGSDPRPIRRRPYFDPATPANVTAVAGKAAYLTCRVWDIGNKTVSWIRHRDLAILSSGQKTYAHDNRIVLYHQPDSNEWVLKIKYVQPRDAGVYGCQLPTAPLISRPIRLNVVVPTARVLGDGEIYVDVGSTLNLTCTVSHSPEPIEFIFWYHDRAVIDYNTPAGRVTVTMERASTTDSHLTIRSARSEDSGIYTCSPSNADPASVKVHVLKGEKPAAMQTNRCPSLAASLALLLLQIVGGFLL